MKKRLARIITALILFIAVFTVDQFIVLEHVFPGPVGFGFPLTLYLLIYLLVGYDVIWKALRNIGHGQFLDENFLMLVATLGAFGLGIYRGVSGQPVEGFDEGCAVLLFYQFGEWFQKYATGKSRQSITELMNICPDYANLKNGQQITQVDPGMVKVGDVIVVNPGERVPLDGVLINGRSSLDTKSLTGETLPRPVTRNDMILSGCINLTSQIEIKVTKLYHDSTVSKILDLVENAAMKKSKSENFITKFARYYTPIVVVAAVVLLVCGGAITGGWSVWLSRALSFLVVSCPCALVISIPLSFFVALGTASKQGVLVKGSNYFEKLNQAKSFVFDKTGTLSKGNFVITQVIPAEHRDEILRLAAIAEKDSSHPIAECIRAAWGQPIPSGYTLTNAVGSGVIVTRGKEQICCGNAKLMDDQQIRYVATEMPGTVVYVAHNGTYVGALVIQDEIKPEAHQVIGDLTALKCQTVMLTGDQPAVAKSVAEQVGVGDYRASLLPQDKVQALEELIQQNHQGSVCFVGDGINDAPVLMRADVGIAMGGVGSDAAIEAADVVLMHDDLRGLTFVKHLARKTMHIVRENILGSLLIKIGILALAAFGFANMWLAVFGDVGVTILAVLNAARLSFCKSSKKRV